MDHLTSRRGSAGFFKFLVLIIIIVVILAYYRIDLRQVITPVWEKFSFWVNQLLQP